MKAANRDGEHDAAGLATPAARAVVGARLAGTRTTCVAREVQGSLAMRRE
jgi:hypothetical protein